jgi:hypothetical protein
VIAFTAGMHVITMTDSYHVRGSLSARRIIST